MLVVLRTHIGFAPLEIPIPAPRGSIVYAKNSQH
jgi:hypothetical protein